MSKSFSNISAPHVLKGPESLSIFVTLNLVAVGAKQLITARGVSEYPKIVRQSRAMSAANLRAAAAIDVVYLQRSNVFIIPTVAASRAILRMDLPQNLVLSFGARMLGHDGILHARHARKRLQRPRTTGTTN